MRSPVPDLLFEDIQAARIRDISPYLKCPGLIDAFTPLHRMTIFLTYQCNLHCAYCKSSFNNPKQLRRFPHRAISFTMESFEQALRSFNGIPIRHMHFTGGEAALVRELPQMVRSAKDFGVSHTSITSNGTLSFGLYQSLIESGLDEIRISIDAGDPQLGAILSGQKQAWPRTIKTLRKLISLRSLYPHVFIITNTVLTSLNRLEAAKIARYLVALGVSDLKFITAIQEKYTLGNFPEIGDVIREMEKLIEEYPPGRFDLLKHKIQAVFDKTAIGLENIHSRTHWRCYVPLTERTMDATYYYPCSVYLREGGRPIGTISEPVGLQRQKIVHFVSHANCLLDPICRGYCLNCTKKFNVAANRARENPHGLDTRSRN